VLFFGGILEGFVGILIRAGSARSFNADMMPVIDAMILATTLGDHVGSYTVAMVMTVQTSGGAAYQHQLHRYSTRFWQGS
jgi:hypothetical protein